MAYNVRDILTSVGKNGTLLSNRFFVQFNSPAVLKNQFVNSNKGAQGASETEKLVQIRAEQARLPGLTYMVSDVNRYGVGPNQKMPYNVQFTDTSITFLADKNGELFNYFYVWASAIFGFNDPAGGKSYNSLEPYTAGYKDDYTTDLNITMYDPQGAAVTDVTMRYAFPISINEIPLDWNQQNQLVKLTVGFSFKDWIVNSVKTSNPATQAFQNLNPLDSVASRTNNTNSQRQRIGGP